MSKKLFDNFLRIEECSQIPKYEQIVKVIISDIQNGIFKQGEKIPSINETSAEFYISRDTVEKAYKILKGMGAINSVKGKGYFVSEYLATKTKNYLLVAENFTDGISKYYKLIFDYLKTHHNSELHLLISNYRLLKQNNNADTNYYSKYIILNNLDSFSDDMRNAIKHIDDKKIISFKNLDANKVENYINPLTNTTQLYAILNKIFKGCSAYEKFYVLSPENNLFTNTLESILDYFLDNKHDFELLNSFCQKPIKKNEVYIVWENEDLIKILNQSYKSGLEAGIDFGILCMDNYPIYDYLAGGITRIYYDENSLLKTITQKLGIEKNDIHEIEYKYKICKTLC